MKGRKTEIEFFTSSDTVSASGFVTDTSVSYWITRAEVTPLKDGGDPNRRKTEGYQADMQTGYVFKMRYRSDKTVTKSMQVVYNNKTLTIHRIENVDEANKELRITALGSE